MEESDQIEKEEKVGKSDSDNGTIIEGFSDNSMVGSV